MILKMRGKREGKQKRLPQPPRNAEKTHRSHGLDNQPLRSTASAPVRGDQETIEAIPAEIQRRRRTTSHSETDSKDSGTEAEEEHPIKLSFVVGRVDQQLIHYSAKGNLQMFANKVRKPLFSCLRLGKRL